MMFPPRNCHEVVQLEYSYLRPYPAYLLAVIDYKSDPREDETISTHTK